METMEPQYKKNSAAKYLVLDWLEDNDVTMWYTLPNIKNFKEVQQLRSKAITKIQNSENMRQITPPEISYRQD